MTLRALAVLNAGSGTRLKIDYHCLMPLFDPTAPQIRLQKPHWQLIERAHERIAALGMTPGRV